MTLPQIEERVKQWLDNGWPEHKKKEAEVFVKIILYTEFQDKLMDTLKGSSFIQNSQIDWIDTFRILVDDIRSRFSEFQDLCKDIITLLGNDEKMIGLMKEYVKADEFSTVNFAMDHLEKAKKIKEQANELLQSNKN